MNMPLTKKQKKERMILLVIITSGLAFLTSWLLSHGFSSDAATQHWSVILSALGASEIRIENLTFLYPHLPMYLLVPFYYIPGLDNGIAPYIISVAATALLLYIWIGKLNDLGLGLITRVVIITLVVIHPFFLWAATSGNHVALSLLFFYVLYRGAQIVIAEHDLHSYIALGCSMAALFFIDTSSLYLFVALLPMLAILAPKEIVRDSPISIYLIVGVPFLLAMGSWAYANWIFTGDPLLFLSDPKSDFLGGQTSVSQYPWLAEYGGKFFEPLSVGFLYMLIAYPVTLYMLLATYGNAKRFRASLILFLHLIIAIGIATSQSFLVHPVYLLALMSAGIMAEMTLMDLKGRAHLLLMVLFLASSIVGGWLLLQETASPKMKQWLDAFQGNQRVSVLADLNGDVALGKWLDENRNVTLIDHEAAYQVVVARGDAEGLVPRFSREFKIALRMRTPDVEQIVVSSTLAAAINPDAISAQYPSLYEHGMKGFELVYDHRAWRVYRKSDK